MKTKHITGFTPVFKIQGKVYHLIGSLLHKDDETPKFAQIYFLDDKEERIDARVSYNDCLKENLIEELQEFFETNNNYAKSFLTAVKRMNSDSLKVISFIFTLFVFFIMQNYLDRNKCKCFHK